MSAYFVRKFSILTGQEPPATPDDRAEELGDYCLFCGKALSEHDCYCRGCGGEKSFVSALRLADRRDSDDFEDEEAPPVVIPQSPAWEQAMLDVPGTLDDAPVRAALRDDVNVTNEFGETPLMISARLNLPELAEWLLEQGADPNVRTRQAPNNLEVRLGQHADRRRAPGQTALINATGLKDGRLVQLLLDHGADPHLADGWQQTPVLWAVVNGNQEAIQVLLAAGADLNQSDDVGLTPLLAVPGTKRVKLLSLLCAAGADPVHQFPHEFGGLGLVHQAALFSDIPMLKAAVAISDINAIDSQLVTPLAAAIAEERIKHALELIRLGADVNASGGHSAATPLWAACRIRDEQFSLQLVEALLAADADPNLPGLFQEPPLLTAVARDHGQVVQRLLDAGADILATDPFGLNVLIVAARCSCHSLLKQFLNRSLDPDMAQAEGRTPLTYAHHPDIIRLLIEHGADINSQSQSGLTALMYHDDDRLEAVQTLLELGIDVHMKTDQGLNAIDVARLKKAPKLAELLERWIQADS